MNKCSTLAGILLLHLTELSGYSQNCGATPPCEGRAAPGPVLTTCLGPAPPRPRAGCLDTTSLHPPPRLHHQHHHHHTYLRVVEVGLEPVVHHGGRQGEPEVHEAQAPDVGGVAVVDQAQHLLLRQLQRVQLVQEAEGGGDDSAGGHPAHPAAHPRGAAAGSLAGARGPGLEVVHLVVDLVHHLVEGSHLEQLILENIKCHHSCVSYSSITLKYGEPCTFDNIRGFKFIVLSFP